MMASSVDTIPSIDTVIDIRYSTNVARREKRRDRIKRNPQEVRPSELFAVLKDHGWVLKHVSGSHHTFAKGGKILTIPFRVPYVKVIYVKMVIEAIGGE